MLSAHSILWIKNHKQATTRIDISFSQSVLIETSITDRYVCDRMFLSFLYLVCRKYEEIYPPDVSEFCYITDDTYNKKQVLRMEHLILEVLAFECSPPTAHFFANHFSKLSGVSGINFVLLILVISWHRKILLKVIQVVFRATFPEITVDPWYTRLILLTTV